MIIKGVGKSLNTPPYGVRMWWYQGFDGIGEGLERDMGGYIYHLESTVGVGKEESQSISEFANRPFS